MQCDSEMTNSSECLVADDIEAWNMNSFTRILRVLPEGPLPNYLYLSTMLEVSEKEKICLDKDVLYVTVIHLSSMWNKLEKTPILRGSWWGNKMQYASSILDFKRTQWEEGIFPYLSHSPDRILNTLNIWK